MCFNHDFFRCDLEVVISESELTSIHFDFLVGWVLHYDWLAARFSNRCEQLDFFDVLTLLNRCLELIENVLTSHFFLKGNVELVYTRFQSQEV